MTPRTFQGSCHCGNVTFELTARPTSLSQCNCSLCAKKGALYIKVREIDDVRVLTGLDALSLYQFNTHRAKHYFCKTCGIHVFHRPRLDPERWSVNARCLDSFDISSFIVTPFDGRNWEAQAMADGWNGGSPVNVQEPRIDDRIFKVWEYQVSHGQLLVRSPKSPATATAPERVTNIDLIFVNVRYMALPRQLCGLAIADATSEEVRTIESILGERVESTAVRMLVSGGKRFPIVAGALSISENEWDIFDSPFEFRSRFRGAHPS